MNIEMKSVKKSFQSNCVLNGINLKISPSDIMLIVGKNGAGKTTILRLLLGLYTPDEGSITIDGIDSKTRQYQKLKKNMGFLNDNIGLFRDLTVWENVEFFHRIYFPEAKKNIRNQMISDVLKRVELYNHRDEKIDFFSRGMRQRLAIARAIVNQPNLLILDEPNRGLDVEGKEMLKEIVQEYHKKGATVLVNSHDLNDIQEYVTHLSFLSKGKIVYAGSYCDLIKNQQNKQYRIRVENPELVLKQIASLDYVLNAELTEGSLIVSLNTDISNLSKWFALNSIEVYELIQMNQDLVALYKQYIQ
ncbi:heme ABC exporter ATP-binding protein CcmA [[Clostridium] polysaccharolyticum]|uniref:ABC-2 type transport system ATP-binding protein n=1 Tax=[Clostridium] polysaccharolyticum TaxID=29364 RepID=A0A1I0B9F2_9FIRM|nr:heme ABC exporter ATP-binding protein CcmA [[Clostridium] polysaccharolyticum]SET03337.1 ABC-2 type transport system ATP-binding protein [[Clostridium] polysaccharolyticum]